MWFDILILSQVRTDSCNWCYKEIKNNSKCVIKLDFMKSPGPKKSNVLTLKRLTKNLPGLHKIKSLLYTRYFYFKHKAWLQISVQRRAKSQKINWCLLFIAVAPWLNFTHLTAAWASSSPVYTRIILWSRNVN